MRDFSNEETYMLLQAVREKMLKSKERVGALKESKWPDEMKPYISGLNKDLIVLKRLEQEFQSKVGGLITAEMSAHT